MNIGFGSISSYDSIRHDLFFDTASNTAFFTAFGQKYTIKLSDEYINIIAQNKKIWITLTQLPPSKIFKTTKFEPTISIM